MEIPVLIEPVAGNGFRATGTSPFPFTVEAATREDALRKVQDLLAQTSSITGTIIDTDGKKVPYVNVTNAYWSPYARPRYRMPSHPVVDIVGVTVANAFLNRPADGDELGHPGGRGPVPVAQAGQNRLDGPAF